MPKISVVIPTFNRRELVQLAIRSVLNQTHADVELIVVDDGSTDRTGEALAKYGDRVRYVWQQNSGESVARQKGIDLASGDYIAFLDSDDIWLPEKLEKQLQVFEMYPAAGMVYTFAFVINDSGDLLGILPHCGHQSPEDIALRKMVLANRIVSGSTLMFRRACLRIIGSFDPMVRFAEDWDLCLRFMVHYPIGCLPKPLVQYRLHQRGWLQSVVHIERMLDDHLRILSKFFALPEVSGSPRLKRLEDIARAERYAFAAFHYYAYGDGARGKEALTRACEIAPQTWLDRDMFLEKLSDYAMLLVEVDKEEKGFALIETVADNLPPSLSQAGISKLRMLSWLHVTFAHWYNQIGNAPKARAHLIRAMRMDPKWLTDRGSLSLLQRALVQSLESQCSRQGFSSGCETPWVVDHTLKPPAAG